MLTYEQIREGLRNSPDDSPEQEFWYDQMWEYQMEAQSQNETALEVMHEGNER